MGPDDHIKIIGCPSLRYFGKNPPELKPKKIIGKKSKIAVCFTPYADSNELCAFYDRIWREYPSSFALLQDQCEALLLSAGAEIPIARVRTLLPSYKQHFMIQQRRCRIHPHTSKWISMLKSFDFAIGSRIHGCIAPILAGVPTLLIANDDRQVELAQYHRIPYIRHGIIRRDTPLEALYEYAYEQMGGYYEAYHDKLKEYTDFLTGNGLPVNPDFL